MNISFRVLLIVGIFVSLTAALKAWAVDQTAIKAIQAREKSLGLAIVPDADSQMSVSSDRFSVSVTVPINNKNADSNTKSSAKNNTDQQEGKEDKKTISISTSFFRQTPTVEKQIIIKSPTMSYLSRAILVSAGQATKPFTNETLQLDDRWWIVYDNAVDVIAYNQMPGENSTVELKEWIYAREPNSLEGSRYNWSFNAMGRRVKLKEMDRNRVGVHQEILVNGLAPDNEAERERIIKVVRQAMPFAYILESPLTAVLEPVVYWTNEGKKREGRYEITGRNTVSIAIDEPKQNYPLVIDPTINFGDWFGNGEGQDVFVNALAVNGGEVYAGGYTNSFFENNFGTGTWLGTYTANAEGFVVELCDNSDCFGGNPSLTWFYYLGGAGDDSVTSLTVNGDEIYAGGFANGGSTVWETIGTTVGTGDANSFEGFVIEIDDSVSPPVLHWRQWLGGFVDDQVLAMTVTGDEIYAGGYSFSSSTWDTVAASNGTYQDKEEGFVVEIADNNDSGSSPTIAWRQWLGGKGLDIVRGLDFNGDEIYAGGDNLSSTVSWTNYGQNVHGTYHGNSEGWIVEIADGSPPAVSWLQWVGSEGNDKVLTIAVNGTEIYAGGYSSGVTASWTDFDTHTDGTYSALDEGWVLEIADASTPTSTWFMWLGGNGFDRVTSLAVNGNDLYAGGYSLSSTVNFEAVGSTLGEYAGPSEGWVVEIVDSGAPGTYSSRTWIGADGDDRVNALAVVGDEIYAGGYSSTTLLNFETFGSESGERLLGLASFVVEIADAGPPTLPWVYWLGGRYASTIIRALAVNGDEIYAGGDTSAYISMGATQIGTFSVDGEGFVAEIADGATPSVNWLQWLGGVSGDNITALAVNGDEIYAGGSTFSFTTGWDTPGAAVGTNSGDNEGWVVEIDDSVSPPVMNWRFWLGGTWEDYVLALAVTGDEIYVGGYTSTSANWETPSGGIAAIGGTWQAVTAYEGFVAEIADGGPPGLNWLTWIGGDGDDTVYALAVTGDEIYAGGDLNGVNNWDIPGTTVGTTPGGQEGFVVEFADPAGATPTMTWRMWLGGGSSDVVRALVLNGDEIYAGGFTNASAGWETVSFLDGDYTDSGKFEGFLVEISDGSPPDYNWLQWLGGDCGSCNDLLYALAINGNEIYTAGYSTFSTNFDTGGFRDGTFVTTSVKSEGWVVEVNDLEGKNSNIGWLQWLGSTDAELTFGLAVNGEEIYAGGSTSATGNWETTLPDAGVLSVVGFYLEIQDRDRRIILIQ